MKSKSINTPFLDKTLHEMVERVVYRGKELLVRQVKNLSMWRANFLPHSLQNKFHHTRHNEVKVILINLLVVAKVLNANAKPITSDFISILVKKGRYLRINIKWRSSFT